MTWVRFEDRFPWHRKVRGLSDAAFRLHVSAVCWSVEHLTDGQIEDAELALVSDVRKPTQAAAELEQKGLWDVQPGGWEIHDFLTYNESRAVVTARREADADRKRRGREGRNPPGSPGGRPGGHPSDGGMESARTTPARPEPKGQETSSPVGDDAPGDFTEFWQQYPRKVGKQAAIKAYRKARKLASAADILAGTIRFAAEREGADEQYTAHPASWLNAGRWEDEPSNVVRLSPEGFALPPTGTDPHDEWGFE